MNSPTTPRSRYNRVLVGLVAALALLNVALVAWIWLAPGHGHPPGPRGPWPGRREPDNFLADTLQFSAAQRAQYDSLRTAYFRQLTPMMERAHARRLDYYKLLDSTLTNQQLLQRAEAGHAAMAAVDVLTLRHFQQVAALCTPPQRQLLSKVLRRLPIGPGGPPPPGGRGGGRSPDGARHGLGE